MLARMNFASTLAANQKFNLATAVKAANASKTPEALLVVLRSTRSSTRAARRERHGGAVELPARDRRVDRQRRAAAGEGRPGWCT